MACLQAVRVVLKGPDPEKCFEIEVNRYTDFQEMKDEIVKAISLALGMTLDPKRYKLHVEGSMLEPCFILTRC